MIAMSYNNLHWKKYAAFYSQKLLLQDMSIFDISILVFNDFYEFYGYNENKEKLQSFQVLQ